jgi:hypothetical protein
MPLADEIKDAIDKAVADALSKVEFRAGTIVLSPSYQVGDPLTVVLDGSARAIEVKMIRAFNVFPNARVACARVGVDWTAFGVFLDTTQANIVAGIPGGGRIEFDPYTIKGSVYDEDGNLVIELDKTEGVSVYDPQGDAGNRTRMMNEFGQLVLAMLPATGYGFTRLVTNKEDEGLATERVRTALEASYLPGQAQGDHVPVVELFSQRSDGSLGPRMTLTAEQESDNSPQSRIQLFAGIIDLQPWASDTAREVRVTNAPFTVNGDQICGSTEGINGAATSTPNVDDTASTSYVNMAGTGSVTSFSFTKRYAATRIRVDLQASFQVIGTGNSAARFAVLINGTDYDIVNRHVNPALTHAETGGTRYISGVAAGTYTVQGRWRRTAGTQTLRRASDDWLSISATEVD